MNRNWSPQPDEKKKMKIGFIGLGIMGSRMAANLEKQGNDMPPKIFRPSMSL
jgi:6-phosphogluconate dehydrogenase